MVLIDLVYFGKGLLQLHRNKELHSSLLFFQRWIGCYSKLLIGLLNYFPIRVEFLEFFSRPLPAGIHLGMNHTFCLNCCAVVFSIYGNQKCRLATRKIIETIIASKIHIIISHHPSMEKSRSYIFLSMGETSTLLRSKNSSDCQN